MAYAVSLLFDVGATRAVAACWQRLADAGLSRSMLDLGYPPHVTLAVFDQSEEVAAASTFDDIFDDTDLLDVSVERIATFGAGSGVCYLALAGSADLMRLHHRVVDAAALGCRPHYRIGSWTPHCTLATNLSDGDLCCTTNFLERDWQPLKGAFIAAELVQFAPIVSIKRWMLGTNPRSTRRP